MIRYLYLSIRALPFSLNEIKVARPRGFEQGLSRFVARYSIQLSYERAMLNDSIPISQYQGITLLS
ncbi:hypothetical protein D6V03_08070 [Vibrio cholerae]|nr:hypothetical protein [Vibrio cholerae]